MNKSSDMLTAIGSAVVTSVIVSWTLTTFTMSSIHRELDQIHRRTEYYHVAPATPSDIEYTEEPSEACEPEPLEPEIPEPS